MTKPLNPLQRTISQVKKVITPKSRWNIGSEGLDSEDNYVHPRSKKACQWCLLGALKKVTSDRDPTYRRFKRLARVVVNDINGYAQYSPGQENLAITTYNDGSTHKDVIDLLDEMKKRAALRG